MTTSWYARHVQIDVFQVVGARSTNTDLFHNLAGGKAKPATITTFIDRRYGVLTVRGSVDGDDSPQTANAASSGVKRRRYSY